MTKLDLGFKLPYLIVTSNFYPVALYKVYLELIILSC